MDKANRRDLATLGSTLGRTSERTKATRERPGVIVQIARQQKGGKALSVITVDSPVEPAVLEKLKKDIDASTMKAITVVSS
jgi:hypothetical protein